MLFKKKKKKLEKNSNINVPIKKWFSGNLKGFLSESDQFVLFQELLLIASDSLSPLAAWSEMMSAWRKLACPPPQPLLASTVVSSLLSLLDHFG